jgi:hypothetical protein
MERTLRCSPSFRTASVGTNKKNAFDHLVHLCANLDCFEICAIQRGAEEEELRSSTNTPLADTIVCTAKRDNDPIVSKLKNDVMASIANRLGHDIFSVDSLQLENYFVLAQQKACKSNDRDDIIACDYLRKLNVSRKRRVTSNNDDTSLLLSVSSCNTRICHWRNV